MKTPTNSEALPLTNCSPSSLTDAVAEIRIVKGKPREIVDADFARELERQLRALVTVCDEYGGGASIPHPRYTRQLSTARKLLENVKGVARRRLDVQSEANEGRYPPLPLPSCSLL